MQNSWFNAVLPGFTEHVANETANAIQKIDAYAAANSSQSSEEFSSGIQNIINSTSEGFRDWIVITDIFSEVKLQEKKQYFFDGSTGTYPLSCLDQNSLKTIIDKELTSAKDYANKIINAH
ncbi:hypothetical protein PVAND_003248 [Polypedilum vanderplanki]|uniref:Uncharacterized protein n=1 Tax=Polypedilum vanderplanki TaxID=319348 RepID=A0A9J6BUG2_POLVA|nr:hypothetical protein PVAND_003248 [Polypedilum vanderplanki]